MRLRRIDAREVDTDVPIQEVLDDHHRVIAFLHGLGVETLGELRKVGIVVPHRDGDVLVLGIELMANLIVQEAMEFAAGTLRMIGHALTLTPKSKAVIQVQPY
jgi:hypothetical protein